MLPRALHLDCCFLEATLRNAKCRFTQITVHRKEYALSFDTFDELLSIRGWRIVLTQQRA
jgi:hypothetical protein